MKLYRINRIGPVFLRQCRFYKKNCHCSTVYARYRQMEKRSQQQNVPRNARWKRRYGMRFMCFYSFLFTAFVPCTNIHFVMYHLNLS